MRGKNDKRSAVGSRHAWCGISERQRSVLPSVSCLVMHCETLESGILIQRVSFWANGELGLSGRIYANDHVVNIGLMRLKKIQEQHWLGHGDGKYA